MTDDHCAHVRTFRIWRALCTDPGFTHEVVRLYVLRDRMLREIARDVTNEVLGPDSPYRKLPKLRGCA